MRAPLAVVTFALLLGACRGAPPTTPLAEAFAAHDPGGPAIDHSAWQRLLNRFLVARHGELNRVDYAALAEQGIGELDAYLAAMARIDPAAHPRAEQMAYWINLYNALTVRRVAAASPVDSILDIGGGLTHSGPWKEQAITVNGRALSLDDIEHGILRRLWREPRVHFAVNCASVGCPDLQPIVFTGRNLEAQLALAARSYLASPRGVLADGDTLQLSSLFDWYAGDFGGDRDAVLAQLADYADEHTAIRLRRHDGPVRYAYDWALNAAR